MDSYKPFSPKSDRPEPPEASVDFDGEPDSGTEQELTPVADSQTVADPTTDDKPAVDEQQARLDYVKSVVPPRSPKKSWLRVAAIIVIALILIAGAAWAISKRHSNAATPKQSSSVAKVAPSPTSSSTGLANYVSNGQDLNLSFQYPSNWTVTPLSGGNANDQTITLNSPLTTMTSASGSSVTGKVTAMIRPGSAQLSELNSSTTAAQASVQFGYTKPTSSQHQYPYLTFIHVAATTNPAGSFNEVLVTGINQFQVGDSLTAGSISVDPIISASFYGCSTSACSGASASALSITNDTWQNANVFKQTLAIFESLQLN